MNDETKHSYSKKVPFKAFPFISKNACPQNKKAYSAEIVKQVVDFFNQKDQVEGVAAKFVNAAYACDTCKGFHHTSTPAWNKPCWIMVGGAMKFIAKWQGKK